MKKHLKLFLLFSCLSIYALPPFTFDLGPTLQYTRYKQGALPNQKGFMIGPDFNFMYKKVWRPMIHIGFKGLWDIPHICSKNGLIVDSNEYQVNGHVGFCFKSYCQRFLLTPFTGLDFIYLRHEITTNMLKHRYFQVNVPVGLDFTHNAMDHFSWGITGYYDIDVWTRLKVSTPDVMDVCDGCETSEKIKLKRCHRFFVKAPFTWHYRTDKRVGIDVIFKPVFVWQKFNKEKECPTDLNIPILKQWHLGSTFALGINF